jgi:hypothetical protein
LRRFDGLAAAGVLLLALGGSTRADTVKGEWSTNADRALAAARKGGKPVLAVAMDHG